jgi:hypothetical protein
LVIPVWMNALISGHHWSTVAAKVRSLAIWESLHPGQEPVQPMLFLFGKFRLRV